MGGSSTPAPSQITAANQIADLQHQSPQIFGMEQTMQPNMAAIGNTVERNNAAAFNQQLYNVSTGPANQLATNQTSQMIQQNQQFGSMAGSAIQQANPWLSQLQGQAQGAYGQGQNTAAQANSLMNQGRSFMDQGTSQENGSYRNLSNAQNGSFVNNSNPTLANLNNTVNGELKLGGNVTQQEMNSVDQTTGSAFAGNGLFNSNLAAGADLLNRDQFSQNRLQQWTGIGSQVQGLNAQQQQNLIGAAQAQGTIGANQMTGGANLMSSGSSMQQAAGQQMMYGMNAQGQSSTQLQSGIQSLVNPDQLNSNISSLMSGYNSSNVTPQYTNSLLGTTSSINSTNAQGQFAANSANTQQKNASNAANTQLAATAAVSSATIAASFA